MTHCYQWFSFPAEFSVECPKCKENARCTNAPIVKTRQVGGGTVCEAIGEPGVFEGEISCLNCGFSGNATIHWPENAFWKCEVKGKTLWAWSLEHAQVLLEFIQSTTRDVHAHPAYASSLLHLPSHFKLAKNRASALAALRRLIGKSNSRNPGVFRVDRGMPS